MIAENIKNPVTGEVIIKKDKLIDELDCEKIAAGVKSVNVYSVITCASTKGVSSGMLRSRFSKRKTC